jgi:hypothetical protein
VREVPGAWDSHLSLRRRGEGCAKAGALGVLAALASCAPRSPPAPSPPPPTVVPDEAHTKPDLVDFAPKWHGTSFGAYLAPEWDWAKDGGGVDVLFELHAGQLAEKEWRAARVKAVVVVAAFGVGSGPYDQAFQNPARFGKMIDEVLASMQKDGGAPLHLRHLGLVSFSAGFGGANRILCQARYFEQIDALLLLDSLHTSWNEEKKPDLHGLDPYIRFAEDAKAGRKVMVLTHSSIKTYDAYPDSTQTATALLDAIGVGRTPLDAPNGPGMAGVLGSTPEPRAAGALMRPIYRADSGAFHAFGFKGETKEDHMDHLAIAGDLVKEYVARRWAHMEVEERAGQRPSPIGSSTARR